MDEEEYKRKYINLKILKSVHEYLKSDADSTTAVYPIRVPEDLLYQVLQLQGPENADKLIHHIFKMGLHFWSEKVFQEIFGSHEGLESFVELVKRRSKE